MAPEHPWSDAWLLQAVLLAGDGGPARLEHVIARGDEIEHAIFTLNELRYGISRLQAAGLLAFRDGLFYPTEAAIRLWQSLESKSLLRDQLEGLARELRARPWEPGYDPNAVDPDLPPAPLTVAELEAATRVYEAWFAQQLHRLEDETS